MHMKLVRDVMPYHLKIRMTKQVRDVPLLACEKIIHTDNAVASAQQVFTQMTANKASTTSDKNRLRLHENVGNSRTYLKVLKVEFTKVLLRQF